MWKKRKKRNGFFFWRGSQSHDLFFILSWILHLTIETKLYFVWLTMVLKASVARSSLVEGKFSVLNSGEYVIAFSFADKERVTSILYIFSHCQCNFMPMLSKKKKSIIENP